MSDATDNMLGTGNFIHAYVKEDLGENTSRIHTRFPPEPNGYLHIGHAKGIIINYEMARIYGGKFNLRFDDTNPAKENTEFVNAIQEDIKWLGCDWEDRLYFASDYFERLYDCAITLIKKGKAYVCELTADDLKSYRGTLSEPGKNSPYRDRSIDENLDLFERMKNGEYPDGSKTLRAKIDMASPNINMRDPVIYRIARSHHHNTGDRWCIYPMYDYAHPLEDAIEGITHSLCSLEFEDHRPLYDWFINELDFEIKPRQIEFAKLQIGGAIMGKRYLRELVESGTVEGWDDPRLVTLRGLRRRGYTKEAIKTFIEKTGVSKANSTVDFAQLEACVRDDLKPKAKTIMAVIDPIKVIITNYPEDQTEALAIENNPENPDMGEHKISFSRELWIEREDFMEDAPPKFFRLSVGKEVRLKGAYFITCNEVRKDADGNITELLCTYDPETRSGSGFTGRKVKGTIHWVNARDAVPVTVRLFDALKVDDQINPDSLKVVTGCLAEREVETLTPADRVQFIRNGYFCIDEKLSNETSLVFNRIVSLKSSFKVN